MGHPRRHTCRKKSVDIGHHTRGHTSVRTLEVLYAHTLTNTTHKETEFRVQRTSILTEEHNETQTAPRRACARFDANLGNGVGDPSTEEGRLVLGTRERQLTGNLPRRRHVQRHRHALRHQ